MVNYSHIQTPNGSANTERMDPPPRMRGCHRCPVAGGYKANPGSQQCFDTAKAFLDGIGAPVRLVTGNHDLEGAEFPTDAENLAAWCRVTTLP